MERRLSDLATRTGRTKAYHVVELIEEHIDDLEDRYLAEARLEKRRPPLNKRTTSEEPWPGSLNKEAIRRRFGKPLRHSKYGLWRYRVRDHRIICEIQAKRLVVLVVAVGHRRKRLQVSSRSSPLASRTHISTTVPVLGFVRQTWSLRWDLEPRFQLFGFSRTAALPEE